MSGEAGCAERFLCALFATVVKPVSDLRLLISGLYAMLFAPCLPAAAQPFKGCTTNLWVKRTSRVHEPPRILPSVS
jgi:hypothetical protein